MGCTTCPPVDCTCPVKDLSTDCSIYNGTTILSEIGTNPGTVLTQVLLNINDSFAALKADIPNYLKLGNIGSGAKIYKGISGIGTRELRSIVQGTNILITENSFDIELNVASASEDDLGVIEIATQGEVDAGTDTLKAVTPSTLGVFISDPANLPIATETSLGIVERATIVEVGALVDTTRYVSPAGLGANIANTSEVQALISPTKFLTPLGISSLIASAAEVNALTIVNKFVTPGRIPIASQTQKGVAELATTGEANALTDLLRVLTPGTLPISSETQLGLAERATTAETLAGTDDVRYVTPLKLKSKLDSIVIGAVPTNTSDLVNDGADGINPFITANSAFSNLTKTAPYTLVSGDSGSVLHVSGSGAITVPAGLPSTFECGIIQVGTGTITIAASGTTLRIPSFVSNQIRGEHAQVLIRKATPANTYNVLGNLTLL